MLLGDPNVRRLMVFSHPNHELAVYGLVQRLRPHILYLSDGGSAARVEESRRGLEAIGVLDRARFLDVPEARFYEALLEQRLETCSTLVAAVRRTVREVQAEQGFCDAVEFYNPVHDLTLPLVRGAVESSAVRVVEVPVIYQRPGNGESYAINRFPATQEGEALTVTLSSAETARKRRARDEMYPTLQDTLGAVLAQIPDGEVAREVVRPAADVLPVPNSQRVLRYEWRARLLRAQGAIDRVITYAEHYRPLAERVWRSPSHPPS